MTNQLQMLALSSIDDFTKLFCPPAVSGSDTCRNLTCIEEDLELTFS